MPIDYGTDLADAARDVHAPLTQLGIDPDEAAANRGVAMARVAQTPLQRESGSASAVSPAGNTAPATPASAKDFTLQAMQGGLDSAKRAATTDASLDAATSQQQQELTDLDNRRAAVSTAQSPYVLDANGKPTGKLRDQYKPGIGTKILRGVADYARGGILGAVAPKELGLTPYNAPNAQYQREEQQRQSQAAGLGQQLSDVKDRFKTLYDQRRGIGQDTRATATAFKDVGTVGVDQQKADTTAENDEALASTKQELADLKAQGKTPQTYEQMVLAAQIDPDPTKRSQYAAAAKTLQTTEIKKFQQQAPEGVQIANQALRHFERVHGHPPATPDEFKEVGTISASLKGTGGGAAGNVDLKETAERDKNLRNILESKTRQLTEFQKSEYIASKNKPTIDRLNKEISDIERQMQQGSNGTGFPAGAKIRDYTQLK